VAGEMVEVAVMAGVTKTRTDSEVWPYAAT
jgi:hypothetical protein